MFKALDQQLQGLFTYDQRPELKDPFELPQKIDDVLNMLIYAGDYLKDNGKIKIEETLARTETLSNVLDLVQQFVDNAIRLMTQVRIKFCFATTKQIIVCVCVCVCVCKTRVKVIVRPV